MRNLPFSPVRALLLLVGLLVWHFTGAMLPLPWLLEFGDLFILMGCLYFAWQLIRRHPRPPLEKPESSP